MAHKEDREPTQRPIIFDVPVGIKMPRDLKVRALNEAKQSNRTISWIVRDALMKRFAAQDRAKRTKGKATRKTVAA